MSEQGLINKSTLNDIATAINTKLGESDTMKPSEMAEKIGSIPNGLLIDSVEDLWRNASLSAYCNFLDYNELITTGREFLLPTSDPQITGGTPYHSSLNTYQSVRSIRNNYEEFAISYKINYSNGLYNTITVTLKRADDTQESATMTINNPLKFNSSNYGSRGLVNTFITNCYKGTNYATLVIFIDPNYSFGEGLDLADYLTVEFITANELNEMTYHYPLSPDGNNYVDQIKGCSYKISRGHYLIGIHTGTSAKTLDFSLGIGIKFNVTIRDSQSSDYEDCSYFIEPCQYIGFSYYGYCLDEMFVITSGTDLSIPLTSLSTSKRKRSQEKKNWSSGYIINDISQYWFVSPNYIRFSVVSAGTQVAQYLYDSYHNIGEPCMYDIETLEAIDEIHGWTYNSETQKYEKGSASIRLLGVMNDEVMMVGLDNGSFPAYYDEDLDCFIIYDSGEEGYFYVVDNKILGVNGFGLVFRDGVPDFSICLQSLNSIRPFRDGIGYCYLDITLKGE